MMDGWTDRQLDGQTIRETDRLMCGWTDRWIGCKERLMSVNGQAKVDGETDGEGRKTDA